jgi:hypothetical protein
MVLSSSPNPVARASRQTLDPEENGHRVALRCPTLDSSAGGLHLNGGVFAVPDGKLALARSDAREVPVIPTMVSSALDSDLLKQFMEDPVGPVHVLPLSGARPAQSFCVSSTMLVGLDSGKDCSEGERDLKADLMEQFAQKRIPASEKMKWRLDGSPGLLQDFNAPGDLMACCDLSYRSGAIGGLTPSNRTRRPILRSCDGKGKSGALAVEDEGWSADDGWSVVKPKFWWRKSSNFHGDFKQQSEMQGSDFFKQQLRGKCFNCLPSDHFAYLCSTPVRCWQCLQAGLDHILAIPTMGDPIQFEICLGHSSIHSRKAVLSPRATSSRSLTSALFKRGRSGSLHSTLHLSSQGNLTSKLSKEARSWKRAIPDTLGHDLQELSVLSRGPG